MIEQPVSVPEIGSVSVDVLCLNPLKNHALSWECKSGRTIEDKQARVYSAIRAEHLQRTGNVTFREPRRATAEAIYCCLRQDAEKIKSSLDRLGSRLPIISLSDKAELFSGQVADQDLQRALLAGIDLPPLDNVPKYLIANTQTPRPALARMLFATLVSLLRRQIGRMALNQILEETFGDWACMGTDLRRYLHDRFKELIRDLVENELHDYASVVKATHSPQELFVEFSGNILGRDASSRTRTFQKFERLAYSFIERLENNRPYDASKESASLWLPGFEPEK